MKVDAKLNNLRIAPRKVRLVADLVRGCKVSEAESRLRFTIKRAASPLNKLLKSAVCNAEHNFDLKKDSLYISEIKVDEGPTLKRWRPRARGSANQIHKKTSHVTLVLEDFTGEEVKKGKKQKIEKVRSDEKPKEDLELSKEKQSKTIKKEDNKPKKEQKAKGKNIFRRKSI